MCQASLGERISRLYSQLCVGLVWEEAHIIFSIGSFLSSPQIITVEEAKRRKSTCSYYEEEEEEEEGLPILQPHSALLENMHIEQVGFPQTAP